MSTSGVLLLNWDLWASRSVPACLCNHWGRSGQHRLHCGFCKSQNKDLKQKKIILFISRILITFCPWLVVRYFPSFYAVVCGGAYGQETTSAHWFDGNGSFISFSHGCHAALGKCLRSPLLNPLCLSSKVTKKFFGLPHFSGPAQMDVLCQHCGHFQFCSLFWNWPWPHPLVYCGWALQPGAAACCHCSCWFLQLVC